MMTKAEMEQLRAMLGRFYREMDEEAANLIRDSSSQSMALKVHNQSRENLGKVAFSLRWIDAKLMAMQ